MNATGNSNSLTLDPRTYARGLSCVHCGLCLPACPTYTQNFNEADSPRGRIQLMLALSDGTIQPTESVRKHLDLCLDCRGCETACPSGVVYHELIEETREKLAEHTPMSLQRRVMRWMFFHILTHPKRLRLAMAPGRLFKQMGLFKLLPGPLAKMGQMIPSRSTARAKPVRHPSPRPGKRKVVFFPGCIGSVIYGHVNQMAIEILEACGAEVRVIDEDRCCGAIHHHNGATESARELAKATIDAALPPGQPPPDMIVSTIAGCGAMLHEYSHLLRDDPGYRARAAEFSTKMRDVSQALLDLGLPQLKQSDAQTVTYHDACHLAHAQGITAAPRKLLQQIPGLKLIPLPESDICCGAAGTYNITQPEMATELAARKLRNIAMTECNVCVAGNVGCAMHIQSEAERRGQKLEVVHPVELLHRAVFG